MSEHANEHAVVIAMVKGVIGHVESLAIDLGYLVKQLKQGDTVRALDALQTIREFGIATEIARTLAAAEQTLAAK